MPTKTSVSLQAIITEHNLETVYMPKDPEEIAIICSDVNRPGLQIAGFFDFFDNTRIQVIGKTEMSYLENLSKDVLASRLDGFAAKVPPAIIVCRELEIFPELLSSCERHEVPLLCSDDSTSSFLATLISYLNLQLARCITRHGVFVEVYGEGVLLTGDSGVGKSETAIELIKRGHRLIADDAVEIRKVSSKTLIGTAPDNIRHFIELRGIGIVNARRIFGMGAVKMTEKIDMIINLEQWDNEKTYDRMGLHNEYGEIMDIRLPMLNIPVRPGRNLAVIIEVAAMNSRQKKMGYNAAQELMQKLGVEIDIPDEGNVHLTWD